MKKTTFFTILLSLFLFIASNSMALIAGGQSVEETEDWTLNQSKDKVDFYYKIDDCNGQKTVLLKIVNNNDHEVVVSWDELFTDQKTRKTFEGYTADKQLTIPAGRTMQARNCSDFDNEACLIPSSEVTPERVVRIQNFEFKDIKVTATP